MAKKGIRKIEDFKGLGKADVHIHTHYSDGRPTPKEVLDYVQEHTDLDVIAIADHDTLKGALEAQKIYREGNYRFELITGAEITAKEGHILALFIKELVPAGLSAEETIKQIKAQNGLAIAAHPLQRSRMKNPNMATMDGVGIKTILTIGDQFDGIEIINGTPTLADENFKISLLNRLFIFQAETGDSDAHIVEAIGMAYTIFEGKTAKDFKKAVLNHQTRAIHATWSIWALIKYAFFFIPMGFRLVWNTIVHGKSRRIEEMEKSDQEVI